GAERSAREVREHVELIEELRAERPIRVQEIRLEEANADELSEPAHLRLERERLPVTEQVRLLDLRRGDGILEGAGAGAAVERACGLLRDLEVDDDLFGRRPLLGRDVDALEVAEGDDAPLRVLEARLAEELRLLDLHLAAEDLVAGLRVALDLDALDVDERA